MIDLLSSAVGGRVVACNDEFFAEAVNLLKVEDPVWREGVYTDRGKWMDGWETRRRRDPGWDWCVLALGLPGTVGRVTVDTSYFTGNFPESFSLEGCGVGDDAALADAAWVELIGRTTLSGDSVIVSEVAASPRVTHLRLNIYPDGGVARLRVEGDPLPGRDQVCPGVPVDLASAALGGVAVEASDTHYSQPANLLRPTPTAGMWDGWETRRRRGPGHDWAVFRLGLAGTVETVIVDTTHFKGNAPGWVSLELSDDGDEWSLVASEVAIAADTANVIALDPPAHASYVRLSIHPDGGVARLRAIGQADAGAAGRVLIASLNALHEDEARSVLGSACASTRWVESMVAGRPYPDVDRLLATAASAFDGLDETDWLEAFAGHPRIGERGGGAMSRVEQTGVGGDPVLHAELAEVNAVYEERFGFMYIVYATGKTGAEMLQIARSRLGNSREVEIVNASEEQRRITDTRLRRMTCQEIP
ncbi:MAG: allantoicase [Actinobacteria bacterium]|nr:allantoicase [Actinomycetota bacterium]